MDDSPREPMESSTSIDTIVLKGFKSIRDRTEIELRPLTVLAGANSSGKSSAVQPLLLLKQTLEAGYDPGPLLLNGPNVKLTDFEQQVLWRGSKAGDRAASCTIGLRRRSRPLEIRAVYEKDEEGALRIERMEYDEKGKTFPLREGEEHEGDYPIFTRKPAGKKGHVPLRPMVKRNRCFLGYSFLVDPEAGEGRSTLSAWVSPSDAFSSALVRMMHLPGLRGSPERVYPFEPGGPAFQGSFTRYVAGTLAKWQDDKDERLKIIGRDMQSLGLTWKVVARRLTDTEAELRVGRLPSPQRGGARDLVSIADVGVGVSQVLPVIVALRAADPGQIVYIEQPEIHLHPRAQVSLARLLLDAARRGVSVIVETHSRLLLLGVQERIAAFDERYSPDLVALHWFARDDEGATSITTAELDENGAYGGWPEDFAEVALDIEESYIDATMERGG